ncbi:MAG: Gfo/Idh/MocA family oxidoreductase [Ruminococcaceae bacterium]|nr:Gfo/Idh/MocA family oxidoreductase [Oscillospiraceae bacterium]
MKNGKYGIGILGLGGRGVFFGGGAFVRNGHFYIECLCDVRQDKIDSAIDWLKDHDLLEQPVKGYTDIDAFLAHPGLDAVVVATPDFAHADCAVKVLQAKKNMFLVKPMAQSIADCDRIIGAWQGSDVVFMVGLELRYCTLMRDCKALIEAGEIGKVIIGTVVDNVSVGGQYYFHGPRRRKAYIKSLLLEKGTHSLDLANWLVNATPRKVYASGGLDVYGGDAPNDKRCRDCEIRDTCPEFKDTNNFKMDYGAVLSDVPDYCVFARECDVSDNSHVLVDYDNGARLTYMECHFTPEYTREFMFVGDKGKIEAFYDNEQNFKIKLWKRFEKEPRYIYPEKSEGGHGGGDTGIVEAFLGCLQEGKPSMKGAKGARDSAAIAIAAAESEESGMPVLIPDVPYPQGIEI